MGAMTDYLEGEIIKHIFRSGSFTKPEGLYIALFTTEGGEDSAGTEVSGGSYARAPAAPGDANWSAPAAGNGTTSNLVEIAFPAAPSADWGRATHWAIFDAATGGNRLIYAPLTAAKNINAGDPAPTFPVGSLTFQVDD